jgi:hypothetical protein
MSTRRPRPLLAVRLIGPEEIVTSQKTYLASYYANIFREKAICRISTHPARNAGEVRVYLTITPKENP